MIVDSVLELTGKLYGRMNNLGFVDRAILYFTEVAPCSGCALVLIVGPPFSVAGPTCIHETPIRAFCSGHENIYWNQIFHSIYY